MRRRRRRPSPHSHGQAPALGICLRPQVPASSADAERPSCVTSPRVSDRYDSAFCSRVLARTRNDRGQVEPVRRTVASLVLFDSGRTPLEESGSSDAVTAGGMRQADTDLRETLPQVAFFVRTSLPAGLQHLMRSERPAFLHQPPGQANCLHRRQRLFRNRLDAGSPIGQGAAKSIARASLPWPTSIVPVSAPTAGHSGHRPTRP